MPTTRTPAAPRVEISTNARMRFHRDGQTYEPAEMISYHTSDPKVPTVFQSLRDGAVFLKITNGEIKSVDEHEVPAIARQYRVPELVRSLRVAG